MSEALLEAALEYLDMGWSVIPLSATEKRPLVKWKAYQTSLPTAEEVEAWWELWPDADIGIITGAISGLCVVDADNEEAKTRAEEEGYGSPISVKTKRGWHYYFKHPMDDKWRGPRSGINAGKHWIPENGLDFRGDGSYVKAPPSTGYAWQIPDGLDLDDMPVFKDYEPKVEESASDFFSLESINLADYALDTELKKDYWAETEEFVQQFDDLKIPTGGYGRHDRVYMYLSHAVLKYGVGPELEAAGRHYMDHFFHEPLPEHKFKVSLDNIREKEMRNHPERFDVDGNYIHREEAATTEESLELATPDDETELKPEKKPIEPLTVANADALIEEAESFKYLIEPWLRAGTITQIFGYSGHGKSMFCQHALYHLAVGKDMGAYEIEKPAKVLYFDWENGRGTIGNMLKRFKSSFGASDKFQLWTPFISQDGIDLNSHEGLLEFQRWVMEVRPDVIVIDTIRSAFAGLEEAKAESWGRINKILLKLRNAGFAVIWLHHSNKPSEGQLGREAGSTNQLTVVETQMRITQVYADEATARTNAGLYNGKIKEDDGYDIFQILKNRLRKRSRNAHLAVVMEVRYGKVREWNDMMDRRMFFGFGRDEDDNSIVVSTSSPKQRAIQMYREGERDEFEMADRLGKPVRTIRDWISNAKVRP